ncbi:alpha/beta fold hydrolase [Kitasatospora sp. NPDC056273]|uniref:alpha/beta fold hydrolase n=1 Tax=Kitasatospora sp. NPDC056273 TaxID=3345769 RepID=UPI0035E255C7
MSEPPGSGLPLPDGVSQRTLRAGGRSVRIAEAGQGPLVVLLHGFPELAYSWRHQLAGLAAAGFHAVAPDMRGYGGSDSPEDAARYTIHHLVGDAVALIDALGEGPAVLAGHDWGSQVAWHTALMRPDRVRGVAGLSIPYRPRSPLNPLPAIRRGIGAGHYMLYFQTPGVAEAELERDVAASFRRLLNGTSGSAPYRAPVVPDGGGLLDLYPEPAVLPGWLSEDELSVYTAEFTRTGFTGGLNWYRNLDANWDLTAPYQKAAVQVPALYLAGEEDFVIKGADPARLESELRQWVPDLREMLLLPGCGHWIQQERPEEVTAALVAFARSLS